MEIKIRHILSALLLASLSFCAAAQDFTPLVHLFGKNDYSADNQNWAVDQGDDGVIYVGNGSGLLSFDGITWTVNKLPKGKIVRSVLTDGEYILVGSYEEFGYFVRTETGELSYTSLSDSLEDYQMQNDEIWKILKVNDKFIFQSFTSYFTWDGNEVQAWRSPVIYSLFSEWKGKIYTDATPPGGFSELDIESRNLKFLSEVAVSVPFKSPVVSVDDFGNGRAIVSTSSDGLFLFDGSEFSRFRTEIDSNLTRSQINRVMVSDEGTIIIGTVIEGAFAIDSTGRELWRLNTSNVLSSNTILGINFDRDGNVWLALDTGLAMVENKGGLTCVNSIRPSVGAIYDVEYKHPDLWMATNNGLYRARLSPEMNNLGNVMRVPSINGNVWDISTFSGQTFIGTNDSTYELLPDGNLKVVSNVSGGMAMAEGKVHGKEVLVQGTYTYLSIYVKRSGKWVYSHCLTEFMNPLNSVFVDYTGTIWAGHMHSGLYALELSEDLTEIEEMTEYESLNGTDQLPVRVCQVDNRVVFIDATGFYTWDIIRKSIVPFEELNRCFPSRSDIYRICPEDASNYWFISPYEAILAESKGKSFVVRDVVPYSAFAGNVVDGNQSIVYSDENKPLSIITLDNSLAFHYAYGQKPETEDRLFMAEFKGSDMTMSTDSLFSVRQGAGRYPRVPYKLRNISARIGCPIYDTDIYLSHKLTGLDRTWYSAQQHSEIKYNYLSHGHYTLSVRAQTRSGDILDTLDYSFSVAPPWYLSFTAKLLYVLLSVISLWLIYREVKLRLRKKDEALIKMEEEYEAAMEKERLQAELVLKGKELASSTMSVINKNGTLIKIKEELLRQRQALGSQLPKSYFNNLVGIIDSNLDSDDDWNIFYKNFDFIHENFFRNLTAR